MRDILELVDRLDAAIAARDAAGRFGEWRRACEELDDAWEEYWSVMEPLTEAERVLVDPELGRLVQRADDERRTFYRQQDENIRAAWAARESADA